MMSHCSAVRQGAVGARKMTNADDSATSNTSVASVGCPGLGECFALTAFLKGHTSTSFLRLSHILVRGREGAVVAIAFVELMVETH